MKILADIGGTYARFAFLDNGQIARVRKYEASQYPDLNAALDTYLNNEHLNKSPIAIATAAYPDDAGMWRFINRNTWAFNAKTLVQAGWKVTTIINDFEAATRGLLTLPEDQQKILKQGLQRSGFTKCLMGPGTGLGLGYLRPDGYVQKTHGGHVFIAAITQEHQELIKAVNQEKMHPVYEYFVSGPGLINLYQAVCKVYDYKPEANDTKEIFDLWAAKAVQETLRFFHEFFGVFAHTAVVTGHAYAGLYLTGGVMDRLIENGLFNLDQFIKFFIRSDAQSVHQDLDKTPIIYVRDPHLALRGLMNV